MSVTVRPMEAGDLERALDLWAALMANAGEADPRYRTRPSAREAIRPWARDTWLAQRPIPHGWVAVAEGHVVGFLTGELQRPAPVLQEHANGHIHNLWVDADHRRQGLGRRLVDAFVEAVAAHGEASFSVGTLIRDERAVAFWRAMGFEALMMTLVRPPG